MVLQTKIIPCGYMGCDRHCKQEMGKEGHLKAEQSVWYILVRSDPGLGYYCAHNMDLEEI